VQQGYSFRGIDDTYNALAPILAEVGLVIVPSYETREVVERVSANDRALFYVTVKGTYTLISAEDGSSVVAGPFWGEAMDSGDKATNKAMSAAYKYMAMQVFAIPTEGDNDADAQTHEVKAGPIPAPINPATGAAESLSEGQMNLVQELGNRIINGFLAKDPDAAFAAYGDAKTALEGTVEEKLVLWKMLQPAWQRTLKQMEKVDAIKKVPMEPGSQG
jgi:hypothetical protein